MFESLRFGGKLLKVGVLMLIVGALAFFAKGAWEKLFLHNVSEFGLAKITIHTMEGEHTEFLSEMRVSQVTGLVTRKNGGEKTIFQFDSDKIEKTISALPEIAEVKVTRRLPDRFEIKVKERIPVAWLASSSLGLVEKDFERGLLIDREGVPFRCEAKSIANFVQEEQIPVIYGRELPANSIVPGQKVTHEGLSEALCLVAGMVKTLGDYDHLDYVIIKDEITLEATTRNGTRAVFSYFDQKRQLDNFLKLIIHARDRGEQLASANLIPYRLVPVKYR